MRILYHHRTLADGAEGIHIAAMVDAFRTLGHEVRVVGLAPSAAPASRHHAIEYVRAVLPRAAFEMASIGINVSEYIQVRREIERFRPDLVYKRHARYDIAALSAARRAKIPTVLEVNVLFSAPQYSQFEPLAMHRLARRFERRALDLATVVVTVSSPLARCVREWTDANVLVLPNGADPDRFDVRRANGSRIRDQYGLGETLVIGWTGILRDWHGLELLLEALAMIPSGTLLIVGDGPARGRLTERVERIGLKHRVVITGRVAHETIPDYVAAMDVAVVADERTGVASPMKLLEYMSMGRAVVAPRAENICDLIESGVDGLLFEPGDARDLAAQLQRAVDNVELRHTLGANARAKVERERNWRAIAERVLLAASGDRRVHGFSQGHG